MINQGKLKAKLSSFPSQDHFYHFMNKQNHPKGSLPFDYYVLTHIKPKLEVKARILSARLCSTFATTQSINQSSFEYYLHYQGFDRRNDGWVQYDLLTPTTQKIQSEKITTENAKIGLNQENEGLTLQQIHNHEKNTKIKSISTIQIGTYKTQAWYYSEFPPFYHNAQCLYFCDFCLNYYCSSKQLFTHSKKCPLYHPPGDEIYRDFDQKIAIFEIDGRKNPNYCENLKLLAKLFLDHKLIMTLISEFVFYVLCEIINNQYHIVGYFSRKRESQCNLSCFLILPFYQRKGYGKLLISFSYELTLLEKKTGTPERPLSDLGRVTYLSWWTQKIVQFIWENKNQPFSPIDIQRNTGIAIDDIIWAMSQNKLIKIVGNNHILNVNEEFLNELYKKAGRPSRKIKKQNIHWVP